MAAQHSLILISARRSRANIHDAISPAGTLKKRSLRVGLNFVQQWVAAKDA